MTCLRDNFNRPINYLRISVTDRCNFRCVYCMPANGVVPCSHTDILTYEEIARVARAAADLGISKIRLTGGEPLVRLGLVDLVSQLAAIPGIDDLALSTNGSLLAKFAAPLKAAGLRRINVSLDTMRPDRFARLTRTNKLPDVLAGIEAAEEFGLLPIKINVVVIRGMNDDELVEMAARTIEREWHVRFIELMPMGQSEDWERKYVSMAEMKDRLATLGPLEAQCPGSTRRADAVAHDNGSEESMIGPVLSTGGPALPTEGPARYYRLPGARGTIGFISAISEHFCHQCNRLRLTADGRLRPCLMWDREVDLRSVLRQGASEDDLREVIRRATLEKPWGHRLGEGVAPQGRTMSEIGG